MGLGPYGHLYLQLWDCGTHNHIFLPTSRILSVPKLFKPASASSPSPEMDGPGALCLPPRPFHIAGQVPAPSSLLLPLPASGTSDRDKAEDRARPEERGHLLLPRSPSTRRVRHVPRAIPPCLCRGCIFLRLVACKSSLWRALPSLRTHAAIAIRSELRRRLIAAKEREHLGAPPPDRLASAFLHHRASVSTSRHQRGRREGRKR